MAGDFYSYAADDGWSDIDIDLGPTDDDYLNWNEANDHHDGQPDYASEETPTASRYQLEANGDTLHALQSIAANRDWTIPQLIQHIIARGIAAEADAEDPRGRGTWIPTTHPDLNVQEL